MITVFQAKSIIEKNYKARVKAVYDYKKDYYLVTAPKSDKTYDDPMYLVNKRNGDYRFLNPMEDIQAFNLTVIKGPLKTF